MPRWPYLGGICTTTSGGCAVPELLPVASPGVPIFFGRVGDPLVVVLHDWYGRLPELEAFAETVAREGLRVAVPDLYGGVATLDDGDAEALMTGVDVGTALAEVDDLIAAAHAEGSDRVAVTGFSLGGWLALLHAQSGAVDAVVAYYATLAPRDHGVLPEPVLVHYAETDEWGEGEDPEDFLSRLADHGTPVEHHVYFDTVHGFANLALDAKANRRAARLAEARTLAFLREHLFD